MSIDLSQFHQIFYEESFEGLDSMESCLLEIDCDDADLESINTIFRAAHSIKGSSGTFGFADVADFTHVLETLLDQVRDGSRKLQPDHVDLLLQSVDCLRAMLGQLQAGETVTTGHSTELIAAFNAILDGKEPVSGAASITEGTSDTGASGSDGGSGDSSADEDVSEGESTWQIHFIPDVNVLRTGNEPVRMFRELQELGTLSVTAILENVPGFGAIHPEECHLGWDLILDTTASRAVIEEVFEWVVDESVLAIDELAGMFAPLDETPDGTQSQSPTVADVVIEEQSGEVVAETSSATVQPMITTEAVKEESSPGGKAKTKAVEATSIRVGTDKIDSLVNLVGELVITQSMLGQLGEEFDMSHVAKLQEGLAQLEHNTRELQESVMRIRMLPISFSFSRFPRMVRDLSKQLEKKIDLVLIGEQTELDKTVMEKIGDPLVHLVRNSLDHGLEKPAERIAAGKSDTGTVTLNAFHQGGNIIIEITDDGAGLNKDKIRKKAVENGLVGEKEALSDDQINDLIFKPGFSTADSVTDVSGRGVGMDVVRRNIQELNGTIEVRSEEGKGSVFTIRLPLTLAILDGQLIQLGEQKYIIPLVSIVESLQPELDDINHVAGGCDVFRLRDDYIPIIKLWEIFSVEPVTTDLTKSLLVVLESGSEKVALVVDDLLGQQQVVIKSMESNYKKVEGVSGATILGDGTVSLILDISDMVRMAGVFHKDSKVVQMKDRHKAA
ncbi:chemotaxis protein CheA [Gammaproteobacteria bacterium 45_16_T64]|nr:chemotaxis protein CheA [Gammaproteobacteria bacterium 45_16_T64]